VALFMDYQFNPMFGASVLGQHHAVLITIPLITPERKGHSGMEL
jgi:hypothetical protein